MERSSDTVDRDAITKRREELKVWPQLQQETDTVYILKRWYKIILIGHYDKQAEELALLAELLM